MKKYKPYFSFANQFIRDRKRNFYLMVNQGSFCSTPTLAFPLKYCPTCQIFRSPRMIHCNACDFCVRGFDHHCYWLGTCIGDRNYVPFNIYVFTLNIALAVTAVEAVLAAINHVDKGTGQAFVLGGLLSVFALGTAIVSNDLTFKPLTSKFK